MMQIRLAASITLFNPVGNGKLKNALQTVKLIETAITKKPNIRIRNVFIDYN